MEITFSMRSNSQSITSAEFEHFQNNIIETTLPEDYRDHMLTTCNGGIVNESVYNVNFPDEGGKISDLYPIKFGGETMESVYNALQHVLPQGYISIGTTSGGGEIILSLNKESYGCIKEWFADGSMEDLSSSFTDLLHDMRVDENED